MKRKTQTMKLILLHFVTFLLIKPATYVSARDVSNEDLKKITTFLNKSEELTNPSC